MASPVSMYLPSTAAQGDRVRLSNKSGAGFLVIPAAGQSVKFLAQSATNPSYFSTSDIFAAMDLVCSTANTTWNVVNNEGSFGVITPAPPSNPFIAVYAGSGALQGALHFLKPDGSCWGCGDDLHGALGQGITATASSPVSVVGNHSFISLATTHTESTCYGLKADGSVWSWGQGSNGVLGNLTTSDASSPVSVVGNHSFIQISGSAALSSQGYGLKADGSVWSWGAGSSGALGNLTITGVSSPVSVVGNHSFVQISGRQTGCLALKSDGSCWSWGVGSNGANGDGTATSRSSPVAVIGNHSFIYISGSCGTSGGGYGLKIDGSVWSWGGGGFGVLGDGTTTNKSSPVSVIGNHSFIEISSGGGNFGAGYGLKIDGSLWAWGGGSSGALGNLSTSNFSSPISVVGNHSFIHLMKSGSGSCACAWKSDGTLWSFGGNNRGQLGTGDTTSQSSPVLVLNTP